MLKRPWEAATGLSAALNLCSRKMQGRPILTFNAVSQPLRLGHHKTASFLGGARCLFHSDHQASREARLIPSLSTLYFLLLLPNPSKLTYIILSTGLTIAHRQLPDLSIFAHLRSDLISFDLTLISSITSSFLFLMFRVLFRLYLFRSDTPTRTQLVFSSLVCLQFRSVELEPSVRVSLL